MKSKFYKKLNFVQEKLYNPTDTNKRIQHDRLHFGLCTRPLFFFVCNNKTKGLRVHILVSKGQIKSKEAWACCRFSQKRMNKFVFVALKSKEARKTNSFICLLGESTAHQSAYVFIWPLRIDKPKYILERKTKPQKDVTEDRHDIL